MTNELKSLTWKYFWQQKWEEVKSVWEEAWPGLVGISTFLAFVITLAGVLSGTIIAIIIGICLFIPIIIFLMGMIIRWLKSNWTKADERAREELEYNKHNEGILDLR